MTPESLKELLGDTPHMSGTQGRRLHDFILEHSVRDILELGFAHGVSACYMAAALDSQGGPGHILTVDREDARQRSPSIHESLALAGLGHRVTPLFEPTSYTWRLMRLLEEDPSPRFDLCYIDGAHSWFVDGFAFFLADRLLRPGGWMLFDDLTWTYATSTALRETEWVQQMPRDERETPQIQKVYELLVRPHPAYDSFRVEGTWAFARKRPHAQVARSEVVREIVYLPKPTLRSRLAGIRRRLFPAP